MTPGSCRGKACAAILPKHKGQWLLVPDRARPCLACPDGGHFPIQNVKRQTRHTLSFSRRVSRPSSASIFRPSVMRAQGMPGADAPAASRTNEKVRELVTTGSPEDAGIPCAMALRLIPRSSRRSGFLVTVVSAMRSIAADLTPASRRQNHVASPSARTFARLARKSGHRTLPRVRGDREPPLMVGQDGAGF